MGNSESQAALRASLTTLKTRDVGGGRESEAFWNSLWKLDADSAGVFGSIHPKDVREMRVRQPDNVRRLLHAAVTQLEAAVEAPSPAAYEPAMRASRILTRVLPFLFEDVPLLDGESAADEVAQGFVEGLFWGEVEGTCVLSRQRRCLTCVEDVPTLATRLVHAAMAMLFLPELTVSAAQYSMAQARGRGNRRDDNGQPESMCML
jgi:hypothetical protein